MWETWAEWPEEGTPDGSMLHSVIVDPRDPSHLYIGLSGGGVFESVDGGTDWKPLNHGSVATFLPEGVPPHWSVYFGTASTDASLEKVVDLGGSIVVAAEDTPYGRLATAADPTGTHFKLVQSPE